MRAGHVIRTSGLLAAVSCTVQTPVGAAAGAADFVLGAQTHFSQGWPGSVLARLRPVAVPAIRDSAPWSKVEQQRGRIDFSSASLAPLHAYCRGGGDLLLTVQPVNPNYDDGRMVSSDAGLAAFANYVAALSRTFRPCLRAIEVGNEINGPRGLNFAPDVDPIAGYVRTLGTAYRAAKSVDPAIVVLGGSTNGVGTGFLKAIFRAGALASMDGVAIHPYRTEPQNVGFEIGRLEEAMRAAGRPVPIWATEFSDQFKAPEQAPPHLIKMVTLMAAGRVQRAYWYALLDQSWFRNMGLFTANGAEQPAALAMRLVQTRLLPAGRPHRIDLGDPDVFAYRYGASGPLVVWGAPRAARVAGAAAILDSEGHSVSKPAIGNEPLILLGSARLDLGRREVMADSMLDFGTAPWSYWVDGKGSRRPAAILDDRLSSYFGGSFARPLRIAETSAAPAGDAQSGYRAVVRYTAPEDQRIAISACFAKKASGDGVDVTVLRGSRLLGGALLRSDARIDLQPTALARGDSVDFLFARHGAPGGTAFRYRIRMLVPDSKAQAPCP